jgi:hypothetical protein
VVLSHGQKNGETMTPKNEIGGPAARENLWKKSFARHAGKTGLHRQAANRAARALRRFEQIGRETRTRR